MQRPQKRDPQLRHSFALEVVVDNALVMSGAQGLGERLASAQRGYFLAGYVCLFPTGRVCNVVGVEC